MLLAYNIVTKKMESIPEIFHNEDTNPQYDFHLKGKGPFQIERQAKACRTYHHRAHNFVVWGKVCTDGGCYLIRLHEVNVEASDDIFEIVGEMIYDFKQLSKAMREQELQAFAQAQKGSPTAPPRALLSPQPAATPATVSQQASAPATVSQQASVPATVSQQASAPATVSQQASVPATVSQQASAPATVSQQASVPASSLQHASTPASSLPEDYKFDDHPLYKLSSTHWLTGPVDASALLKRPRFSAQEYVYFKHKTTGELFPIEKGLSKAAIKSKFANEKNNKKRKVLCPCPCPCQCPCPCPCPCPSRCREIVRIKLCGSSRRNVFQIQMFLNTLTVLEDSVTP